MNPTGWLAVAIGKRNPPIATSIIEQRQPHRFAVQLRIFISTAPAAIPRTTTAQQIYHAGKRNGKELCRGLPFHRRGAGGSIRGPASPGGQAAWCADPGGMSGAEFTDRQLTRKRLSSSTGDQL